MAVQHVTEKGSHRYKQNYENSQNHFFFAFAADFCFM